MPKLKFNKNKKKILNKLILINNDSIYKWFYEIILKLFTQILNNF